MWYPWSGVVLDCIDSAFLTLVVILLSLIHCLLLLPLFKSLIFVVWLRPFRSCSYRINERRLSVYFICGLAAGVSVFDCVLVSYVKTTE